MRFPQDVQIEKCVLGGILLQPSRYDVAAELLVPDSFYLDGHGLIFKVMGDLVERGIAPDSDAVMSRLRDSGKFEHVGGMPTFLDMMESVVSGVAVETHSQVVADYALRRAAIRGYTQLIEECYKGDLTTDEILFEAANLTDGLASSSAQANAILTMEEMATASADMLALQCSDQGNDIATTGFTWLDNMTGGWQPGDLWIWAARPNTGKTRVLLYSMIASARARHMVGLISLDMSSNRLMKYALTTVLALSGEPVLANQIFSPMTFGPDGEAVIRRECFNINLGGKMLVAPDIRSNSLRAIESVVRQMAQMGCRCIAIDQAQNISEFVPDERGKVAGVIGGIKRMARRYGVCVVLVHQIGRAGAGRPRLEHLKDSGCFEEFSDFVLLLHDPMKTIHAEHGCYVEEHTGCYRAPNKGDDDDAKIFDLCSRRRLEVHLAKSRNGETDRKAVWFNFEQGVKT